METITMNGFGTKSVKYGHDKVMLAVKKQKINFLDRKSDDVEKFFCADSLIARGMSKNV